MIKNKQTLFDYVYSDLCGQIKIGRLSYGDKLPSMSQLCELYHVGIRTVKDVMSALKKDGYIRTEERKAATVIYNRDNTDRDSAVQSVLRQKTAIIQTYETMALILPPIFALSALVCNAEKMQEWAPAFKNFDSKAPEKRKKIMMSFLCFLLDNSGNLLFRELFSKYELYARIPLFQDEPKFESLVTSYNEFKSLTWIADALLQKNSELIFHRFSVMYEAILHSAKVLIGNLAEKYPNLPEDETMDFAWNTHIGRNQLYTQVARDLIDKIGTGIYKEDTFLPPESQLAEEYGVCVSTVRNALAMLNKIGFAKTYNVKGTKVIWQEEQLVIKCLKNKGLRRDALLYLSALQLTAVIIRPAVMLSAARITDREISELKKLLTDPSCITLDAIVRCIAEHQHLNPMKTVLEEAGALNIWGYYYSFYSNGPMEDEILAKKCAEALQYLCEGNAPRLACCLSSCYRHILEFVRDYLLNCGLSEASALILPAGLYFPED